MDALGAMAGIIGGSVEQQIKQHYQQEQQQGSQGVPGTRFLAVQSPQLAPQPALSSAYYAQPAQTTADSPQAAGTQAASSMYNAQPAETAAKNMQVSSAQTPLTVTGESQPYSLQDVQSMQASSTREEGLQGGSAQAVTTQEGGEQGDSTEAGSPQGLSRRLLQQQRAGGLATSLANMGTQAFGSLANK